MQKKAFLKEKQIRPTEYQNELEIAFAEDVAFLLSNRSQFEEVDCPSCQVNNSFLKFTKNCFKYVECRECETLFISPRPSVSLLADFYNQSKVYKHWKEFIFPASENARKDQIFTPRVKKIIELTTQYHPNAKKLLEVGAGFGTFCDLIQNENFFESVVAIEPVPDLAQNCRNRNIETINLPVERVSFDDTEKFDIVVNFEVIEHLHTPNLFVSKIHDLLTPQGLLILTCPNYHGFDIQYLGRDSDSVDHEHLNYFNPSSISNLLEKVGFNILQIDTPGQLDVNIVHNKIMEKTTPEPQSSFMNAVLCKNYNHLGDSFQNYLRENKLSSHMWVVARKD